MKLRKYHGLGNDYLVLEPGEMGGHAFTPQAAKILCALHFGVGTDGVLTGPYLPGSPGFQDICRRANIGEDSRCLCAFRIWNPDGSEAEKSGNGVRIFARWLYDTGRVALNEQFALATLGGIVRVTILDPDQRIRADMGRARFASPDFPVQNATGEATGETIAVAGRTFRFCAVSVGNPHCVVLDSDGSSATAHAYGPLIENAPRFPHRINVQFLKVLGPHDIHIEIWERGAGYTLASGTSSSASAAAAVRLGLCQSPVHVHAPGGTLEVEIDNQWEVTLTGPVAPVFDMTWLGPKIW